MSSEKKHKKKVKEERILPFYNLNFLKQIDVLKAYVAFYEKSKKAAHYKDVASISGVHNTQVSGCRRFWRSLSFLEEKDGIDIPTEKTLEFIRKLEWGQIDDAWRFFRDHIRDMWFFNQITMALKLQKMMDYDEVINSLGSAAGIPRKSKHIIESLRILIDLLIHSRTIQKDEESGKFKLNSEILKGIEPFELPEKKEDLIVIVIDKERYVVPVQKLENFIKEHGKKTTLKEYRIR